MTPSGRRINLAMVSLVMGILLWVVQILTLIISNLVLGVSLRALDLDGTNVIPDEQLGAFITMVIIGVAGLLGIVGTIFGLISLTKSDRGVRVAVVGVLLNACCWLWSGVVFLFLAW